MSIHFRHHDVQADKVVGFISLQGQTHSIDRCLAVDGNVSCSVAFQEFHQQELAGGIVFDDECFQLINGCNKPYNPTTLGPFLNCIDPNIFLSANVKYATESSKGTIIKRIFKIRIKLKNIRALKKQKNT